MCFISQKQKWIHNFLCAHKLLSHCIHISSGVHFACTILEWIASRCSSFYHDVLFGTRCKADAIAGMEMLVLTGNRITNLADLNNLSSLTKLERLSLLDNPVCKKENYRCEPSLPVFAPISSWSDAYILTILHHIERSIIYFFFSKGCPGVGTLHSKLFCIQYVDFIYCVGLVEVLLQLCYGGVLEMMHPCSTRLVLKNCVIQFPHVF